MILTGRVPLLMALGLGPLVVWPSYVTAWVWVGVVACATAADGWFAVRPGKLQITRAPVPPTRLGEPSASVLQIDHPGRGTFRGVVRDAWQPTAGADPNRHAIQLRPGETVRVTTPLLPTRRGDLRATRVTVRSYGALGLAARQSTRSVPGAVRSLPRFESRKHLPSRLAQLRELDGRAAVRVRGQGTEFDSLRDYVRGDDVRSIDWRASSRRRSVVVRTWQPERDRRVVIVLDTSRTSAARVDDAPRLDTAMDAALLLAALAARAGDRVDVVAGDRVERTRIRSAGRRDVVAVLQDALADLEPTLVEANWRALAASVRALGRRRALVVLLTALEPAAMAEGLLPVLPSLVRHHRVVVASVRDPALPVLAAARSDVAEVYTAASAEQVLMRQRETADLLAVLGVDVVEAGAGELAPALADRYLLLKARGLL